MTPDYRKQPGLKRRAALERAQCVIVTIYQQQDDPLNDPFKFHSPRAMPQAMTGSMDYERDVREDLFEQSLRVDVILTWRHLCAHALLLSFTRTGLLEVGILENTVG
jgi:hypothetical protein